MVTIISLHLIFVGIYFLVVSQVAPFEEILSILMLAIGIILIILGIIFRIIRTVALKAKKAMIKSENQNAKISVKKNYYLTYFLVFFAFIFTFLGLMKIPITLSLGWMNIISQWNNLMMF